MKTKILKATVLSVVLCLGTMDSFGQETLTKPEKQAKTISIEDVRNAYIQKVNEYERKYNGGDYSYCDYFLFDITKDGIPELWVFAGTCEADNTIVVYTYENNELKCIYQGSATHSSFYLGKDYVIRMVAAQGDNTWYKFTYSGDKLQDKIIFEESTFEDYTYPKEPAAVYYPVSNTTPIKEILAKKQ